MTKEQRARMQALAVKSELTDEEVKELNALVELAGKAELQTKALGFAEPDEDGEDGGEDIDAKIAKAVDAKVAEIAAEQPAQAGGIKAPAIKKVRPVLTLAQVSRSPMFLRRTLSRALAFFSTL